MCAEDHDVVARAREFYRREDCSCSQAVAAALGPEVGIDESAAMSLTRAFGGGIARTGSMCGAVVSAVMILAVHAGRIASDEVEAKKLAYQMAQRFLSEFKACHGGIECKELLGIDVSTEEGRRLNAGNQVSSRVCPEYVATAARMAAQVMT